MVKTVKAFDGVSIISHEILSSADDEHARAAVRDLSDTDLHLIVTGRDPARQITSAWQQRIRQGSTQTFATVASAVRRRAALSPAQDLPGLLVRWGSDLDPDHVHVVTVPPAGSDPAMLWERFANVVGIDSARFDTSRTERGNEALSWAEAETLRRVNGALDGRIPHPAYYEVVGQLFARDVVRGLSGTAKATIPQDLRQLAGQIADRWVDDIEAKGYDVVGELAELRPVADDGNAGRPNDSAIAEVAIRANAELLIELARRDGKRRQPALDLKRVVARARRRIGALRQNRDSQPRRIARPS
jgi:hypothetical protein